eukprot:GHVH01007571.1.p1 GENE.GHVH01007571.1~~GHVH01007571.1.p1  ORF type:complete len:168 (+),score=49.73 GHVH01007571.1:37-540(+)
MDLNDLTVGLSKKRKNKSQKKKKEGNSKAVVANTVMKVEVDGGLFKKKVKKSNETGKGILKNKYDREDVPQSNGEDCEDQSTAPDVSTSDEDIDQIFQRLKQAKEELSLKNSEKNSVLKFKTIDEELQLNSAGRKFVGGLAVYNEDELKIGRGGDTAECPFDCKCCY